MRGVVDEKELALAAHAAGIVDEGDELGLHFASAVPHVRAKHRVDLPELVHAANVSFLGAAIALGYE